MFFHEVTRSVIFISTEDLRFKIEDILLLFLQFKRRCSTVDPIVSKKITLSLLTHRCLGVICLETDQCKITGICKASFCMYGSENLKESEGTSHGHFQNRCTNSSTLS